MRDYDRRFKELEQRLLREQQRLGSELGTRLDKLDVYLNKEVGKLLEKGKQEKKDRLEADKLLDQNIQKNMKELLKAIAEVDESSTNNSAELRKDLHDLSSELETNLSISSAKLQSSIENESNQLHELKVSRDELAGFLQEIALRLNKEFTLPTDE